MRYFFIDYENVKNQGLNGIERLSETDAVIIFYSQNANTITFDTHKKLCDSRADIRFECVDVGTKNSLDFQLATYIGYVIGKTEDDSNAYRLVTRDSDFGVTGRFWKKKDIDFSVIGKISNDLEKDSIMDIKKADNELYIEEILPLEKTGTREKVEEKPAVKQAYEEAAFTVEELLFPNALDAEPETQANAAPAENTPESSLAKVLDDKADIEAVVKIIAAYKTKSGINNAIVKKFHDSKQAGEIYKAIKPFIKDKKGTEPKTAEASGEMTPKDLEKALKNVLTDEKQIAVVDAVIKKHKTKTGINNALAKAFKSQNNKKAAEIYAAIKPFIKDKKGSEPDELEMQIEAVLPDNTEIPVIVKIIKQYKTKQGINNALMKKFPSQNNQRSSEIYKAIKPLLKDKKG